MNGWLMMLTGAGGAVGAAVRYAVSRWFARRGWRPIFATLLVNLTGSFALGLLVGMQLQAGRPDLYALLGSGFLGGMTTYSTLNVQKAQLAGEGDRRTLARYLVLTYAGGGLLTGLGLWMGSVSQLFQ